MNKKVKTAGMVMALLAAPMSGGQMAYAGEAVRKPIRIVNS